MASEEEFSAAQARVKQLSKTPAPKQLLELYALYKQATVGDVSGTRPGMIDFKGRAKYDAWAERKGQSPEACRTAYVGLVNELVSSEG